ncbi:MAG: serine/threonine-protein kinase [Pseudomonadota bacterium]
MAFASPRRWFTDGFTGLVFSALFLLASISFGRSFFYGAETLVYDASMRQSSREPGNRVAVIAIDDASIDNIGRWPWSRDILAKVINDLAAGGAKVIASTVFVSEPQVDPGLETLAALNAFVDESALAALPADSAAAQDLVTLQAQIQAAVDTLNYDERLVTAIADAGNVVLPMQFTLGRALGQPDGPLPAFVSRNRLPAAPEAPDAGTPPYITSVGVQPPTGQIGEAAAGLGHLTLLTDADGAARFEPLVISHFGDLYPSLSLVIAARSLNLGDGDVRVQPGEGIVAGNLAIRTTPELRMYNNFYPDRGPLPAFQVDSFWDVFTGQITPEKYRDRIVLLGATATGVGDNFVTPVAATTAPVLILAHTVASILNEDFFTRPAWTRTVELGSLALIALYLIVVLPKLGSRVAPLASGIALVAMLVAELALLRTQGIWLQMVVPALFLFGGHVVMTVKRLRVTERMKLSSEADSAESNKMLGLAFQGQGQLDMAFDKFRKCGLSDDMMDVMYNLGLDYERKRQFNKAGAVYEYMAEHNPDYRDLATRLKRSQNLDDTMVFGGATPPGQGSFVLDDGVQKPMLGRYLIEKELGKGAMGVVYLGRDPKINRVVAIKTIPLSDEFDAEELEGAKERFFREAETAGRLNHPDIVTVYDAGEEHDLAYIAMEFLEGDHLTGFTRADNLLPAEQAIELACRMADALAYAHREGVVHRDIKPANIMFNPETNKLKITDFGIARITNSSKTKTGIVLGTPSYMSPEQLAGKNVTGRSDLFSLGVTLYQLLAGQLPFRADSMATLMYKIANEPPTPLSAVRPDLPPSLEKVVSRTLLKDPDERFQSGAELAAALRECVLDVRQSA